MADKKEAAYVLDESGGAVNSTEPQHFGTVPGLYAPGEPVAVSDMGVSASDMAELVKEHEPRLKKTTAAPSGESGADAESAVEEPAPAPAGEEG